MLIWYDTFSEKSNIEINIDKYIDILKNSNLKSNEDVIENKLNQIEMEYENNLIELNNICNDNNYLNELKNKNSLIILQKELKIIKLLTKYALQNNHLDYIFFYNSLKFLYELSEILRIRLNQKEIVHENKILTPNNLPRCSYKFCNFKDACTYNYNITSTNQCYQDHYVHRMVSADLLILIQYIEEKFKDPKFIIHNKEILKTINTLSFVINHMENELKTKCMYLNESEWETCHFVKNIIKN
jgi:hypothetical protein